jgi:hypothetical protein
LQGCTAFSLPRSLPGCRWSFAAAILHGRDPLNARVTTYALIAIIGDIQRFATSKKLVSYLGLNPSVVESGEFAGSGALRQHGRGSLRALLIQTSKRLLTTSNPLQKWGLSVALRRGTNKAAIAVARKLTVARPSTNLPIPVRLLGGLARPQRPLEQSPRGNHHPPDQAHQAGD